MENTIYLDLLGSQVYFHRTEKFITRIIEMGEGEPLILLHGGGGHAETYSRNLARLGEYFRAMAIDFVGHGFSSKPPFGTDNILATFTEQVIDLLDSQSIERVHLEGESLGGWICLDMAINHPQRVGKMILNTAWGMKFNPGTVVEKERDIAALRERSLQALQNPSREAIRKRLEWLMASPEHVTDELVEVRYRIWTRPDTREWLKEYYRRLFSEETDRYLFGEEQLARIRVPTLVLWTDHNPFQGIDAGRRLAERIPNARFHLIKHAAHWPQWEQPEEHDRVVLDFLMEKS